MLRNTFLHLPGIGEKTERNLWMKGCHTWVEALEELPQGVPRVLREEQGRALLTESLAQYQAGCWRYFDRMLPGGCKWRTFPDLREGVLYVDIETTGYGDLITVIGVYDGAEFHAFVEGENLDDALPLLESAKLIVTFNGAAFDMPIIRRRFSYHLFNHVHVDLMWVLKRLGYSGGLKKIERELGLVRSEETQQFSGWDAVLLWREYQRGSREAKELLLHYNEEDVRNLAPLMEWAYGQCVERMDFILRSC
jgi:uncharacterized protein